MRPAPAASAIFFASVVVVALEIVVLLVTRPAAMPFEHPRMSIAEDVAVAQRFRDTPLRGWLVPNADYLDEVIARCSSTPRSGDCDLYMTVRFGVGEWREMVWWLIAGLAFGLIGLAGATRRVQARRSVLLIL